MRILFLVISLLLLLASCSSHKESPVIYFSNISSKPVSDIKCIWVTSNKLTLPYLYPGDSRGQSFFIDDNSDFFGQVFISWRNSEGDKIVREFEFKKNNLPSIEKERSYDYVQFYFDQEGMELVSSDAPDLSYKTVRMDKRLREAKRRYHKNKATSSLIRVENKKDKKISTRGYDW